VASALGPLGASPDLLEKADRAFSFLTITMKIPLTSGVLFFALNLELLMLLFECLRNPSETRRRGPLSNSERSPHSNSSSHARVIKANKKTAPKSGFFIRIIA